MQEFNTNWNIDRYSNEVDTHEQWMVKRKFMLMHKMKFPEERLVCLAQVVCNIKFLGCKYPKKVMEIVEELVKEVELVKEEDFVEDKQRLKRTLVEANDAAAAKVQRKSWSAVEETKKNEQSSMETEKPMYDEQNRCQPDSEQKSDSNVPPADLKLFKDMQACRGPIKNLMVIKMGNEQGYSTLLRMCGVWKRPFSFTHEKFGGGNWYAKVTFDGVLWSEAWGGKKDCKKAACDHAIWRMNQFFYAILMDRDSVCDFYFNRSEKQKKLNVKEYVSNIHILPSNKDEAPDVTIDPNQLTMYYFVKLKNPEQFNIDNETHWAEIQTRLRYFVDEYAKNESETRELMFVRQYNLGVYRPVFEYAISKKLLAKFVGSNEHRLLAVYKRHSANIKPNWQIVWNLVILGKDCVEGTKVIPPKSMTKPQVEKGVRVKTHA